jgi:Domain of unknown function (DUF4282)
VSEYPSGRGWPGDQAGAGRAVPRPADPAAQYASREARETSPPPAQPAPPAPAGQGQESAKGFLAALFDFNFTTFVTPKLIKALYALIMIGTALFALVFVEFTWRHGGAVAGLFTLLIGTPIYFLISMAFYRVVLEFFMVTFRLYEELNTIRRRGDPPG